MERYRRADFEGVESITEEEIYIVVKCTDGKVAAYLKKAKNIKIMNDFNRRKSLEESPNPFKCYEYTGSTLKRKHVAMNPKANIPPLSKGVGKKKVVGQKKTKGKSDTLKMVGWIRDGDRILIEYNNGMIEPQSVLSYVAKGKIPPLSKHESRKEAYKRKTPDNTWKPPLSKHELLQEKHAHDPWKVMVICILLNCTQGCQVRGVLPKFFDKFPDAETCAQAPLDEIRREIHSLGLEKRAKTLQRFSLDYLKDTWTHVPQLHGIGRYAADAYAIFCSGRWEDVVPWDGKLVLYWRFLLGEMQN